MASHPHNPHRPHHGRKDDGPNPADPTQPAPISPGPADPADPKIAASLKRYWRANVRVMLVLLAIWAAVSLGCGVLWAERLNAMGSIGGFPLGFWFAQQGSIIVFVILILVYAVVLNRLDKKHHDEIAPLLRHVAKPSRDEAGDI